MKNLTSLVLAGCALAVAMGGCGKAPEPAPAAPAATQSEAKSAPASEPNFARSNPDAGKVEYVSVTADGRGPTIAAAVDQAIKLAIQQVNGKTMDMSALQFQGGMAVAVGEQRVDIGSSAFAELVATQSRGAVTGFKLLSRQDLDNGDTEVSIEAQVAKFAQPESAGMLRVAVMPFRTSSDSFVIDTQRVAADAIVQGLRGSVTNTLAKTRRVTILDREYAAEVQSELDQLETGRMATDDFARLGEQLMADYVVVGRIERFGYERHERQLRTSDRTLVSHSGGAALSFRVINATTGQVELSDTVAVELPTTSPTTLGTSVNASRVAAELTSKLSEQAANAVVMRLFPLTVVAVEGNDVVLSQGGSMVSRGDVYDVVLRGTEITDPQTGRVIGRMEKRCCTIEVTRVTDELSYATVLQSDVDLASVFAPGALEVSGRSERVASAAVPAATVAASTEAPVAAAAAAPVPVKQPAGPAVAAMPAAAPPAEDPNW